MTEVKDIVGQIDQLEPVPTIASQLMARAGDPDVSLSEIADLILNDPAITANLLKTCNSAYFGLNRKVDSVQDAIGLVGLNHIVQLVMLNSVSKNLKRQTQGYGLGEGALWRHAVTSAHVAKILAAKFGPPENPHLIYTAALLKDIGKLILGRYVAFSLEEINILVKSKGFSFNDAEKKIIGMNHEEIGAVVGQKWCFSDKLIYIIRHHHMSTEAAREDLATALVYLADIVCMMMGVSSGVDGLSYRFYGDVLKQLGLTEKDLHEVIAETGENQAKIDNLLKLI